MFLKYFKYIYRKKKTNNNNFLGEIAVTSTNQDLISASCYAIGEIARKAPLPLPDGNLGWLFFVSYFFIALNKLWISVLNRLKLVTFCSFSLLNKSYHIKNKLKKKNLLYYVFILNDHYNITLTITDILQTWRLFTLYLVLRIDFYRFTIKRVVYLY